MTFTLVFFTKGCFKSLTRTPPSENTVLLLCSIAEQKTAPNTSRSVASLQFELYHAWLRRTRMYWSAKTRRKRREQRIREAPSPAPTVLVHVFCLLAATSGLCILCRRLKTVNDCKTVMHSRCVDANPYAVYISSYALLTFLGTDEISCLRRLSAWNMRISFAEYFRHLVGVGS